VDFKYRGTHGTGFRILRSAEHLLSLLTYLVQQHEQQRLV